MTQAELNIGIVGHVDHGKTTLAKALTGKWTDTHSEEVKRGITIKLGYADVEFKQCVKCGEYTVDNKCVCGGEAKALRKLSFLDAPGHETLMATVIAASSIMDGALFVIAANEKCPQPQTQEHLMVLEAAGIDKVVIAQNKLDLVSKEDAKKNFEAIKQLIQGTAFADAPIIPTAANSYPNTSALIKALQERIPTPDRPRTDPQMFVARSFDVNKPGADIKKLAGGVVGGSLVQGELSAGDEIQILPGVHRQKKDKEFYEAIETKVESLYAGREKLDKARAGGLIAVATDLDPSLTSGDGLVGCLLGKSGTLPEASSQLSLEVTVLNRVLEKFHSSFTPNEPLVLGVGTATTVGFVTKQKKKKVELTLKKPVCVEKDSVLAVMRRAGTRWRLYATAKKV